MIRLKAFDIKDTDAYNEFITTHPPRNAEGQSGTLFHEGNLIVVYDDGIENPLTKRANILTLIELETQKQFVTEHDLGQSKIALKNIAPDWYVKGMTLEEFNTKQGVTDPKAPNSTYNQILQTEQQIDMEAYQLERLTNSIASYNEMLKAVV